MQDWDGSDYEEKSCGRSKILVAVWARETEETPSRMRKEVDPTTKKEIGVDTRSHRRKLDASIRDAGGELGHLHKEKKHSKETAETADRPMPEKHVAGIHVTPSIVRTVKPQNPKSIAKRGEKSEPQAKGTQEEQKSAAKNKKRESDKREIEALGFHIGVFGR